MNFADYLKAKKIDPVRFAASEPELFESWKKEFEHAHPNSFTVQKLNLVNAIRRKYLLKEQPSGGEVAPRPSRPVMRPKPKL